jgi:hypothetical protein
MLAKKRRCANVVRLSPLPSSSPSNPGDLLGSRAAGIELNCFSQKQFSWYCAEFPEQKIHYLNF